MAPKTGAKQPPKACVCCQRAQSHPVRIAAVDSNFEREPLIRPFGFKGGYMSEIWQSVAMLRSDSGWPPSS